jgi:hypothetical protein
MITFMNFNPLGHWLAIRNTDVSLMKFSWAISQVKWLSGEKTNVSKTISILVLRVLV